MIVLAWAVLASLIAAGSTALLVGAVQLRRSEQASCIRAIEREERHATQLYQALDDIAKDHRALIEQKDRQHAEEIERVRAAHAVEVERLMNLAQYGTTQPKDAVVTAAPEDAESRVLRRISEDSIEAGAQALKKLYDEAGIPVSVEEVREEAHSMLLGLTPKVNPERALIPRED